MKHETVLSRKRKSQVSSGLFDGRYRTKVVEDKRKKQSKLFCRNVKQEIE